MANYNNLKSAIQEVIRTNGNNEITGALLQQSLLAMINSLGTNYQFAGVATLSTNPGTPDQNVFYIAGPGTYANMNSLTVPDGTIGLLKYNGTWSADTVAVGKNYDGYLGIVNGPELSATNTQSKFIDSNGNLGNNADFTLKTFSVTGGKSYLISGLEANNAYTCGWAAYEGGTKVAFGANNISSNEAVAHVPDNADTLYVCQPNYGNLPSISVKETTSVIDNLETRLDAVEDTIETSTSDISNIDVANYALLISETYTNKIWNNGQLVDDPNNAQNATSLVKIDKTKPIIPGTSGNADVVFFDANQNYISTVQAYIDGPIAATNIPATAVYVAFNYYRDSTVAADGVFYVSTRPDCTRITKKLYATQNKVKGTRPKVYIYTTDTQETIFKKMVDAIYIEDCDVVFEKGAYTLNSIFYLMKSKYEWNTAYELPVGKNCHYYLNNSTITGNYAGQSPSSGLDVETNSSIFGTHRLDGQTFELHDGELIAAGLVYCVHDEASGGAASYVHKYENMIMRYNTGQYTQSGLSKCIGGGTGLAGEVVINRCKFYNANTTQDISWHGHSLSTVSVFKLYVSNSFFVNGIGLHQLAANETGYLFLSASLVPTIPSGDRWTVFVQAGDTNAVKFVEQTLTDTEKTQARTNIDAASNGQVSQLEAKVGKLGTAKTYTSADYCGYYYSASSNKVVASGSTANGVIIPVKKGVKYVFSGPPANSNAGVSLFGSIPAVGDTALRIVQTKRGSFIPGEGENYALFTLVFTSGTEAVVTETGFGIALIDLMQDKQLAVALGGVSEITYGSADYCGLYFSHSSGTAKYSGSTANGVLLPLIKGVTYTFPGSQDRVTIWRDIPYPEQSWNLKRELEQYATSFVAGEDENYALFTLIFDRATSIKVNSGSDSALKSNEIFDCITEENSAW